MKLKQNLTWIWWLVAGVSLVGAILLLVFAVPGADATYKKVMLSIISALMILLSLLIVYYIWISRDKEPNFFLFDRQKKANISIDALTFKTVNERMTFYQSMVASTVEELWQGDVLENATKLGYRKVYRPLLAYKMLYDLADKNLEAYWELLFTASDATVNSLCSALEQGGEQEMVKAFRYMMEHLRDNPEKIKSFISGNERYIRGRMLGYIKHNIELFY